MKYRTICKIRISIVKPTKRRVIVAVVKPRSYTISSVENTLLSLLIFSLQSISFSIFTLQSKRLYCHKAIIFIPTNDSIIILFLLLQVITLYSLMIILLLCIFIPTGDTINLYSSLCDLIILSSRSYILYRRSTSQANLSSCLYQFVRTTPL